MDVIRVRRRDMDGSGALNRSASINPSGTYNMHPLVARGLHNLTRSDLCSLPDNVLLKILLLLGPGDLIRLRSTSRLFLRLFSSPELAEHQYLDDHPAYALMWTRPIHKTAIQAYKEYKPLKEETAVGSSAKLCEKCQGMRA